MLLQARKPAHHERNETIRLGAVLAAIPDKVTVTVQLHIDVLELLRQKPLCAQARQPMTKQLQHPVMKCDCATVSWSMNLPFAFICATVIPFYMLQCKKRQQKLLQNIKIGRWHFCLTVLTVSNVDSYRDRQLSYHTAISANIAHLWPQQTCAI